MDLEQLVANLNHPRATSRQVTARIIGMVDETRALTALQQRAEREEVSAVRLEMRQIAVGLNAIKRQGYHTVNEICEYFGVYYDLYEVAAKKEAERLKQVENAEGQQQEQTGALGDAALRAAGTAMASQLGSGVALEVAMGSPPGAASNLPNVNEQIAKRKKRAPAQRPGTGEVRIWGKRLADSGNPQQREKIMQELNSINNPDALPYFAKVYFDDTDEWVRSQAKRYGKLLYWRALYWDMEQSGVINEILHKKAAELGVPVPKIITEHEQLRPTDTQDIQSILAKAEESRRRREERRDKTGKNKKRK